VQFRSCSFLTGNSSRDELGRVPFVLFVQDTAAGARWEWPRRDALIHGLQAVTTMGS
jgi:hypothetical protein